MPFTVRHPYMQGKVCAFAHARGMQNKAILIESIENLSANIS